MANTTAPPAKPLAAAHDRLRQLNLYFLEIVARAQAASSQQVQLSLGNLTEISQILTQSLLDLEALKQ